MRLNDYKSQSNEILQKLERQVTPLPAQEKKQRVAKAKRDFRYFSQTYFPHYCEQPFAPFHLEMVEAMENRPWLITPIVRAAPRGFGKSVVVSFLYVMWQIIRKARKFIVIISANDDLASDLVRFVKLEFNANSRLKQDYGDLQSGKAEEDNFIANGIRVLARGRKQMVRGFREGESRPDLIIIDDMEKDTEAGSPKVVQDTLKLLLEGIYPSLAPGGTMMIIGTIIKKRSVLGVLTQAPDDPYAQWNRRIYRAITGNESLWPERWPLAGLLEMRTTIGSVAFEKEYQNNPIDDDNAMFREEWIKRYHPEEMNGRHLVGAMFIDPSAKEQTRHDFKAIITVGRDRSEMKDFVLNAWIRNASIDALLHATFRIFIQYRNIIKVVGLEANGFQALLERDYERLAKEYGFYLPLRRIEHKTAKSDRIERLSSPIERGRVLFRREAQDDTDKLIEQLLYYPNPTMHDDGPDALEGAIRLIDNQSGHADFVSGERRHSEMVLSGFDNSLHNNKLGGFRETPHKKRRGL